MERIAGGGRRKNLSSTMRKVSCTGHASDIGYKSIGDTNQSVAA